MGLLWLRDLASDATDDPFHKLQVFHGASQWGGYCFAKGEGGKKLLAALELRVMCWLEEEGGPRLAG